jgi:hypothetical protein
MWSLPPLEQHVPAQPAMLARSAGTGGCEFINPEAFAVLRMK